MKKSAGSLRLSRSRVGSKLSTDGLSEKKKKKIQVSTKEKEINKENGDYELYFLVGFIEKRGRLSPNPGLGFRRNSPSASFVF